MLNMIKLCKYKQELYFTATVNQHAGEEGQPALIATMLSKDHKPEDPSETKRVESLGNHPMHYVMFVCVCFHIWSAATCSVCVLA